MEHFNSSNISHTVPTEKIVASSVLGLCFILGVPGNIMVIFLLARCLRGDCFTPKLMMSLAVSDLLTLLFLPLWIWSLLHGWIFGSFLCKFSSYVTYLGLYCSLLCVILLSLQRYLQVLHPQQWAKVGVRGQMGLLGGMWMLGGVLASYTPVRCKVYKINEQVLCILQYQNDLAFLFLEILMILVTFFLLTYFYVHLYRGVNQTTFFNSHKTTKLLTRIVVTFFVLSVPFITKNILLIAAFSLKNHKLLGFVEAADSITKALIFLNSCVNPFLYAFSARSLQPSNQHPTETVNAHP